MVDHQQEKEKVLIIGSGPVVIGQGAEFDYAGTQACITLREAGYEVVLINNNPATVMTDDTYADTIYFEPLTVDRVTRIIQKERPTWLLATVSGQTGLNIADALEKQGVLTTYNVGVLGTSLEAMQAAEDREQFRSVLTKIGAPVLESEIVSTVDEAVRFMRTINQSVIIRPAYTLGGTGGGIAHTEEELRTILARGLQESPIRQCLLEKSIAGWKEIEFEVLRDHKGHTIIACQMENMDPVGVHTGDSVVVIPVQTWTKEAKKMLEAAATKMVNALGIVGACNVQFALDPANETYYFIEVNPRVSRSSALASKAMGFPIAQIATEVGLGKSFDTLIHPVSKLPLMNHTFMIDYVCVKFPRWVFDTFPQADRTRGTQMKATGEILAFESTLARAFHKAVRSLGEETLGIRHHTCMHLDAHTLWDIVHHKEDRTFFALIELFYKGTTVEELFEQTNIQPFFLHILQSIVLQEATIQLHTLATISKEQLHTIKQTGYADAQIASMWNSSEADVRKKRKEFNVYPGIKEVQATSTEHYMFTSWDRFTKNTRTHSKKRILIIGSGPIRIGQGIEFDYCSVQAVQAFQSLGYEVVLMNNNPATVSTDFNVADRLYIEPLTTEDIMHVAHYEQVDGVSIQFGGQTALNVAEGIESLGIPLIGTSVEDINRMENRDDFYQFMKEIDVPHIPGSTAYEEAQLKELAAHIGYPILLRPSYVIGGKGMVVLQTEQELQTYVKTHTVTYPILVDAYVKGIEIEIDAVSDGKDCYIPAIFEHIEQSGVHSGDSYAIAPSMTLDANTKQKIEAFVRKISQGVGRPSLFNMQLVLEGDTLYVLEVNPRASRTVPVVSKHANIPLIAYAVRMLAGETLQTVAPCTGLGTEQSFYTMKAPVYSTEKLPGVDPKVQPEMQSTGELMAYGMHPEELSFQAFFHNEQWMERLRQSTYAVWIEGSEHKPLIDVFQKAGWKVTTQAEMSYEKWVLCKEGIAVVSCGKDDFVRTHAQQAGLITLSTDETAYMLATAVSSTNVQSTKQWNDIKQKEVVSK